VAGTGRLPNGLTLDPLRTEPASAVPPLLRLASAGIPGAPAGTLLWFPDLPAGRYRLRADNRVRGASLDLVISIGRTDAAVATWQAGNLETGTVVDAIDVPVPVHSLSVRGRVTPARALGGLWLEPVRLDRAAPIDGFTRATAARRYGAAVVYGLGDDVYLEPGGLWAGGRSGAGLLIVSDTVGAAQRLRLRAGPVATPVTVKAGSWERTLELAAGASREIDVPRGPGGRTCAVEVRAGRTFRPADLDARSSDARLLGVWVEVR
jgi:hypothetical protein